MIRVKPSHPLADPIAEKMLWLCWWTNPQCHWYDFHRFPVKPYEFREMDDEEAEDKRKDIINQIMKELNDLKGLLDSPFYEDTTQHSD